MHKVRVGLRSNAPNHGMPRLTLNPSDAPHTFLIAFFPLIWMPDFFLRRECVINENGGVQVRVHPSLSPLWCCWRTVSFLWRYGICGFFQALIAFSWLTYKRSVLTKCIFYNTVSYTNIYLRHGVKNIINVFYEQE